MGEVAVFLTCVVPILGVGAVLVDLLLRDAPRRGKRPDLGTPRPQTIPASGNRVIAVAPDGRRWVGTPISVARRLGVPAWTSRQALAGLDALVDDGTLHAWTSDRLSARPAPRESLDHRQEQFR
jgi:hypothetical protein